MRSDTEVAGLVQTCHVRREWCRGGWRDDLCFSLAALRDERYFEADRCLRGPCEQIGACLGRVGAFSY
jgi:hypothetical protein